MHELFALCDEWLEMGHLASLSHDIQRLVGAKKVVSAFVLLWTCDDGCRIFSIRKSEYAKRLRRK